MTGTIFFIILAAGVGIYHDTSKPTEYELSMEDGTNTHIVLQKNSQYACPLYCDVDHVHHAIVCKDKNHVKQNQFVYHITKENEYGISFYCSTKKILSMTRFTPEISKDKLPDVVTASADK